MKNLIGALALAALLVGAACSAGQGDDQSLPASGQPAHASQPVQTATPASIAPTTMPATSPTPSGDVRVVSVTRVIDGDTVEVRRPNGMVDRVRLVGVDAPETGRPNRPGEYGNITDLACLDRWGDRATSYLKDKLEGRTATLEPDPREGPRDSFGRLLAYVVQGGEDINARLVELGYARVYTEGRAEREQQYLVLQQRAQTGHLGLWGCSGSATTPGNAQGSVDTITSVVIAVLDLAGGVVLIRNQGASPVDLAGWTLVSEVGDAWFTLRQFTFAPGASVEVVSGGSAVHDPPYEVAMERQGHLEQHWRLGALIGRGGQDSTAAGPALGSPSVASRSLRLLAWTRRTAWGLVAGIDGALSGPSCSPTSAT